MKTPTGSGPFGQSGVAPSGKISRSPDPMPTVATTKEWLFLRNSLICHGQNNGYTNRMLMVIFGLSKEAVEKIVRG